MNSKAYTLDSFANGKSPSIEKLHHSELTRRTFCGTSSLALAMLVLAGRKVISAAAHGRQQSQIAYPPARIIGAEHLMPGSFLHFTYPTRNDPAILIRSDDGQYFAHSRKCAHLGCSVEFDPSRSCLDCPCHHGMYDPKTGSVIYGPPVRSLEPIILQVRAGQEVWAVGKGIGDYGATGN